MTVRKLGVFLAISLLTAGVGCNEIVGIVAAEESLISCDPELTVSQDRMVGCLFRIACDPFLPPFSMSECIALAWQDSAPAETCGYGAQSCDDVDECIGRRYEPADSCTDISGWTCDDSGERAINCTPAGGYSIDCALFGGTCMPHASTVVPSAFGCQHNSPPTCPTDAEEGDYFCEGSQRFTCIDGESRGVDCAEISSDCIEFGPGEAYCSDRTETCTSLGSTECDGFSIEACDTDGYRVRFDCSSEGLECRQDGETDDIACLADGCETASNCVEGCNDDGRLRFCSGGVAFLVDCTAYGYDGCLEDTIKGDVPLAYCARQSGAEPHP